MGKYSIKDQDEVWALAERGLTIKEIAKQMGISQGDVHKLINAKVSRLTGTKAPKDDVLGLKKETDPQPEKKLRVNNVCCSCGHEWSSSGEFELCPNCGTGEEDNEEGNENGNG